MRKIVAGLFMTLNGVTESPEKWNGPYFNDEMGEAVGANMQRCDTLLMGRKLYDEWSQFWPAMPDESDPFAAYINNIEKVVVSTTLTDATWKNTSVINGDIAQGITALKERDGKDIAINGSATLVRSLLELGLLDELQLLIHPVVVGQGAHLFDGGPGSVALTLADAKTFTTGAQCVTYVPTAR